MTINELELEINHFFLKSEKEVDEFGNHMLGTYPNAVILTEDQYKEFLRELFHVSDSVEIPEGVFINSICGLKTIITKENLEKPKVIRITNK